MLPGLAIQSNQWCAIWHHLSLRDGKSPSLCLVIRACILGTCNYLHPHHCEWLRWALYKACHVFLFNHVSLLIHSHLHVVVISMVSKQIEFYYIYVNKLKYGHFKNFLHQQLVLYFHTKKKKTIICLYNIGWKTDFPTVISNP